MVRRPLGDLRVETALDLPHENDTPHPSAQDADAALVEAAARGERDAFASLHDRYAPMVHAVLLSRVRPNEADDLVQDVFLKALRGIHTLRDHHAVGAWLARIARNRAIDHHRRAMKVQPLNEEVATRRPGPQQSFEAREALDAIRELPETYQEILLMRLVEGMNGPEISAATGLTPGSVRVKLHRGMKLLRAQLRGADPDES
jgi:RNA polymerase sigma-70 factor (ECF subfamily)